LEQREYMWLASYIRLKNCVVSNYVHNAQRIVQWIMRQAYWSTSLSFQKASMQNTTFELQSDSIYQR
jgi:hypothetical protein